MKTCDTGRKIFNNRLSRTRSYGVGGGAYSQLDRLSSEFIVSSDLDGIHFEAAEHKELGKAVAAAVREIFGE